MSARRFYNKNKVATTRKIQHTNLKKNKQNFRNTRLILPRCNESHTKVQTLQALEYEQSRSTMHDNNFNTPSAVRLSKTISFNVLFCCKIDTPQRS